MPPPMKPYGDHDANFEPLPREGSATMKLTTITHVSVDE
jgi:hypothetical protein